MAVMTESVRRRIMKMRTMTRIVAIARSVEDNQLPSFRQRS